MVAFSSSLGSLALVSSVEMVVVLLVEDVLCLRLSLVNLVSPLSLANLVSPLSPNLFSPLSLANLPSNLSLANLVSPLSLVEPNLVSPL